MLPSAFTKGSNPDANRIDLAKLQSAVQFSQIIHYKDSILLLQMNAGAPLFQVFPNGSIRAVNLPKVDGFTADSVVPSDELLYIRYRRIGTNSGRADDALILEIDINSGETLRRIHTGDFTIWDVACAHKGDFRVTKLKGEHTFQFFTATVKANAQ